MQDRTCKIDGCEKPKRRTDPLCGMHRARMARYGSPDLPPPRPRKSLDERVLARVIPGPECWAWNGYHDPDGYARLGGVLVYRHTYVIEHGAIPAGMEIDHACHNRGCVNPAHLRAVTHLQNIQNFTRPVLSNNTSGYRGVYLHRPSGLWNARAMYRGKLHSAGYFKDPAEAAEAARGLRLQLLTHNDLDRGTVITDGQIGNLRLIQHMTQ